MNFLAHAYLSMGKQGILTGNLISDFVKGKKILDYPLLVQKGIRLHRSIDAFTDAHPATKEINKYFHPHYRLYAAAFTDIVYDFFLANDTGEFGSRTELNDFTESVYAEIEKDIEILPAAFGLMFPYMQNQNWLFNYRFEWGIQRSFGGLARRAKYISESDTAFSIFMDHSSEMKLHYDLFFPMLKQHAIIVLEELLHND